MEKENIYRFPGKYSELFTLDHRVTSKELQEAIINLTSKIFSERCNASLPAEYGLTPSSVVLVLTELFRRIDQLEGRNKELEEMIREK